ncbi:hypothetical protein AU152_gp54 [Mycobacterium phage Phlei]|uniref:Uncharacterized protein n=1 Tax=Mycobacterium phage Phlei TaxID=1690684 RepID=A0A0N7E4J0_9CAUD|nr:hypothetical protein AU152_gp54 [Mycobacterium phage Phlei]ALA48167.1 hypothetical protein [Mycobacterium phage Phlei]
MTATPNAMPRNVNPIRRQIVTDLTETKKVKIKSRILSGDEVVEKTSEAEILRFPLAENISEDNVKRLIGEVV